MGEILINNAANTAVSNVQTATASTTEAKEAANTNVSSETEAVSNAAEQEAVTAEGDAAAVDETVAADEAAVDETAVTEETAAGDTTATDAALSEDAAAKEALVADGAYINVKPMPVEGGSSDSGMGEGGEGTLVDPTMGTGTVKNPLLSSWLFVIGISAAVLFVSLVFGALLARRKIKKGIELYED